MEKGEILRDAAAHVVQYAYHNKARRTKRKRKQKHRSPIVSTPMHKVFCQAFFQKAASPQRSPRPPGYSLKFHENEGFPLAYWGRLWYYIKVEYRIRRLAHGNTNGESAVGLAMGRVCRSACR